MGIANVVLVGTPSSALSRWKKGRKITPWGYSPAFSLIQYFTNNLVEEMKVFAGHYITQLTDCLRT